MTLCTDPETVFVATRVKSEAVTPVTASEKCTVNGTLPAPRSTNAGELAPAGAVVSITTLSGADGALALPAASTALTVSACAPSSSLSEVIA